MNCTQARNILNEVLDRESPAEEPLARKHLHTCGDCRKWWSALEAAGSLLSGTDEEQAARDIAAAVMARLPERHPASVSAGRERRLLSTLAWVAGAWLLGAAVLAGCFALAGGWSLVSALIREGFVVWGAAETVIDTLLVRLAGWLATMGLAAKVLQSLCPYLAAAAAAEAFLVAAVVAAVRKRRGRVVIRCF